MKNKNIRINKINKLLQKKISNIINSEINKEIKNFITITHVSTSKDLSLSKIFITSLIEEKNISILLNKYSGKIRQKLSKDIKIYNIPKIIFFFDTQIYYEEKIIQLLKQTKNN